MLVNAAVHIHSNWSNDATWLLDKLARFFQLMNYQIVFMSEHDISFNNNRWELYLRACRELCTEKFLLIPGIEYSDLTNRLHILTWGNMPFLGHSKKTENILKLVNSHGGISVFAHPGHRNAQKLFEPDWYEYLIGIEVWNRKADGISPSSDAINLKEKYNLLPFYGLDFHHYNQFFPLAMEIDVSGVFTTDNAINALRNGQCYPKILGLSTHWSSKVSHSDFLGKVETLRRKIRPILKRTK